MHPEGGGGMRGWAGELTRRGVTSYPLSGWCLFEDVMRL